MLYEQFSVNMNFGVKAIMLIWQKKMQIEWLEYIANRFKEDQLRKQLTLESENSFKGNR